MSGFKIAFEKAAADASAWVRAVRDYPYREKAVQVIYDTPIEIAIGAVALSALFGGLGYAFKDKDEGKTQVAFSELGSIRREAKRDGADLSATTEFNAAYNDFLMKPLEAYNITIEANPTDFDKKFASELELKIVRSTRVHHLMTEYAEEVPQYARAALKEVAHIEAAANALPPVQAAFARAWKYENEDFYKIEYRTEEVCSAPDAKGNRDCHEEKVPYRVYDHTVHTYTWYPEKGEQAYKALASYLDAHPDVRRREAFRVASQTGADNEYAMETSALRELLKGRIISAAEALGFSHRWAEGSNLAVHAPEVLENHEALKGLLPKWQKALSTAKSDEYRTSSRSDDGPAEYRLQGAVINRAGGVISATTPIVSAMRGAIEDVPVIMNLAKECVAVEMDRKKKGNDDACDETIERVAASYRATYARGLDVNVFGLGSVFLWSVIGLVAGGLAGAGVDNILNKRRRNHTLRNFMG